MRMYWICVDNNMVNHPAWRGIGSRLGIPPGNVLAVWVYLLSYSSRIGHEGSLVGLKLANASDALGYSTGEIDAVVAHFEERGLIREERIPTWEEHQFKRPPGREKSGGSTPRVREHRAAKRETPCNATESESQDRRLNHTTGATREPSNLRAPDAAALGELDTLLRAAAGEALAQGAAPLNDISAILGLLGPGRGPPCDLQADILPAVRTVSARTKPGKVFTWNFFIGAICERRDARLTGAPPVDERNGGSHERAGDDGPARTHARGSGRGGGFAGAIARRRGRA